MLNYFVFLSPLALTEKQWIANHWLFTCGTYVGINELYAISNVIISNIFMYNNWVFKLQPDFCCSGEWIRNIWAILFWIPMELHTTFKLIRNGFDMISVITMNSKGINEDLLLVGSCCRADCHCPVPGWPHLVRTFGLDIFNKNICKLLSDLHLSPD